MLYKVTSYGGWVAFVVARDPEQVVKWFKGWAEREAKQRIPADWERCQHELDALERITGGPVVVLEDADGS
jgi:hypothetical protein